MRNLGWVLAALGAVMGLSVFRGRRRRARNRELWAVATRPPRQ